MTVARPPVRGLTRAQWWPVMLIAVVFATMNLTLYTAVDRLGLGLAVTLEFLGPLAVALFASRTRKDALVALAAAAGVYVLVLPGPSSDGIGVALGLTAAACWAAYILLNRTAGARLPGLQAPAARQRPGRDRVPARPRRPRRPGPAPGDPRSPGPRWRVSWPPSSRLAADLTALRYVPARFFGVFMSAHPALAALAGLVILGQTLAAARMDRHRRRRPRQRPRHRTAPPHEPAPRRSPRLCSRRRPTSGPRRRSRLPACPEVIAPGPGASRCASQVLTDWARSPVTAHTG